MTGARLDSVCRYICEKSGWTLSNLGLQKILYLCQMFYMGRHNGDRLVSAQFEAWDYGPVVPELYHRAKNYGADPLPNIFENARRFHDDDPRKEVIDAVCNKFLAYTPGQLVGVTHWKGGAWARHYQPGIHNVRIPDRDIGEEYNEWQKDRE